MKPSLGLSDEDFLKQDPATFIPSEEEIEAQSQEEQETPTEEEIPTEDVPAEETSDGDSEAQEETDETTEEEEVSQPDEEDPSQEHETSSDSEESESLDTSDTTESETKADEKKLETEEFDYKSAYERVSSPFKANGTEIQAKDPTDIIRLMQMGANYQKKMQQLKPHLKMIKMLENNDLLDEASLHNLIDLAKKDPKAVAKLIKDSGVDPLDIDTDSATEYTPNNYSVSDREYNLDQVLDGIKDTETFDRTIQVLTKEWDGQSKQLISDNPEVISIINTHMGNGVFDMVNQVLQQEKALGKLQGVSDVEAYRLIAENLQKDGVLKTEGGTPPPDNSGAQVSSETETLDRQAKAKLTEKRKAAAPVKRSSSSPKPTEEDFLGLSDEDFMKRFSGP